MKFSCVSYLRKFELYTFALCASRKSFQSFVTGAVDSKIIPTTDSLGFVNVREGSRAASIAEKMLAARTSRSRFEIVSDLSMARWKQVYSASESQIHRAHLSELIQMLLIDRLKKLMTRVWRQDSRATRIDAESFRNKKIGTSHARYAPSPQFCSFRT